MSKKNGFFVPSAGPGINFTGSSLSKSSEKTLPQSQSEFARWGLPEPEDDEGEFSDSDEKEEGGIDDAAPFF